MKNLLIYYNPEGKFMPVRHSPTNYDELTKIQIDNSLDLGWKKEDIVIAMNFPYEYNGVKAHVVGEGKYDVFDGNRSSKLPMLCRLFDEGVIGDDVYWFHDHDAFQLEPFKDLEDADILYTDHGWTSMWNAGSFFFKKSAKDIFDKSNKIMYDRNLNEQTAFTYLLREDPEVAGRCKKINISYNFGIYYHPTLHRIAIKPIKVAHFQPHKPRHLALYTSLVPERFLRILNKYGLKAIS